jgi:hypothetical protein
MMVSVYRWDGIEEDVGSMGSLDRLLQKQDGCIDDEQSAVEFEERVRAHGERRAFEEHLAKALSGFPARARTTGVAPHTYTLRDVTYGYVGSYAQARERFVDAEPCAAWPLLAIPCGECYLVSAGGRLLVAAVGEGDGLSATATTAETADNEAPKPPSCRHANKDDRFYLLLCIASLSRSSGATRAETLEAIIAAALADAPLSADPYAA